MALADDLTFAAGTGRILFSKTLVTTAPTPAEVQAYIDDPTTPMADFAWDLGHTSLDEGFQFEGDDGTTKVLGTFQKKVLREVQDEPPVDRFTVISNQPKDSEILKLYYGGGTTTAGGFQAPSTALSAPTVGSALLILVDGVDAYAAFCRKVSIKRNGQITFPPGELAQVPLQGTILDPDAGPPIEWIDEKFVVTP